MNDLKIDLINRYLLDKYYAEREIIRLSEAENICQLEKVERVTQQIDLLIQTNMRIELVEELYKKSEDSDVEKGE